MDFLSFATAQGLIINNFVSGRIVRCPTVSKPNKKNGAYFYNFDYGFVQDWGISDQVSFWFKQGIEKTNQVIREARQSYDKERQALQTKAAAKAKTILSESELLPHYYLEKKGFKDMTALVYENKLVIPMRINNQLTGIQTVTNWGEKKFLYGQNNKLAVFRIGNGRFNVLCEGYATGLSIAQCLTPEYSIWVCFSAGNMVKVAESLKNPRFIVADNDESKTGEQSATKTGCKYFLPPETGQDFNDYWLSVGRLKAQIALKKAINS